MEYDIDKIDNYLSARLTEKERLAFESSMQNDKGLEKAVKEHQLLKTTLREIVFQQKKEEFRALLEKIKIEEKPTPKTQIWVSKLIIAGVILLGLLFAIISWYGRNDKPAESIPLHIALAQKAWLDSPELFYGLLRNNTDLNKDEKLILLAYDAYTEKKYTELQDILSRFTEQSANYEDVILLKALAQYNQQNEDEALVLLNAGLQLSKNKQHGLMQWYKSLLMLKAGKVQEARMLLQDIANGKNQATEQAKELLKKL